MVLAVLNPLEWVFSGVRGSPKGFVGGIGRSQVFLAMNFKAPALRRERRVCKPPSRVKFFPFPWKTQIFGKPFAVSRSILSVWVYRWLNRSDMIHPRSSHHRSFHPFFVRRKNLCLRSLRFTHSEGAQENRTSRLTLL